MTLKIGIGMTVVGAPVPRSTVGRQRVWKCEEMKSNPRHRGFSVHHFTVTAYPKDSHKLRCISSGWTDLLELHYVLLETAKST